MIGDFVPQTSTVTCFADQTRCQPRQPLQPGEFRLSSSPAPLSGPLDTIALPALCTTAAPLSSTVELPLRVPLHRAPVAPPRPCARLASSRRTPALPSRCSACSTPPLHRQRRSAAFHSALLLSPSAAFHLQSLKP
ncbi:hypothetical protein U1Q18_004099 [Sarracenia purpurea var. burkii]